MNPFNFVRMGIANAHSASIYGSPLYGPNSGWTMKTVPELTAFANKFLTMLALKPYGPYKAAQLIFGTAAADSLTTNSFTGIAQFLAPPRGQPLPNNKRARPSDEDGTSNHAAARDGSSSRKRYRHT